MTVKIDSLTKVNKRGVKTWAIFLGKYEYLGLFKDATEAMDAKELFTKQFTMPERIVKFLLEKNKNKPFNKEIIY